eukprot:NODE_5654_length_652_cov_32.716418_g5269_i0.p1 GENE.NODE_5654_length_652_cov_32.716418_g5269_i0~~NODE_5654_length_652_cov_32.716418_g5269_i0.p1  ORF type:complete len:158 (-),score=0.39 NODE_5654_length_652_cov_32.716418_g5269_i0:111-584(-)
MSVPVLVITLFVTMVASRPISLSWTDCSTPDYIGKISNISYSENPTLGLPFYANCTGMLSQLVTGGYTAAQLFIGDRFVRGFTGSNCVPISVDFRPYGRAEISQLTCPQPAGPFEIDFKATLVNGYTPSDPLSATVKITSGEQNGNRIFCVNINIKA